MDCGSRYNFYDICMLHYEIYRSFVAQMVELVVIVRCLLEMVQRMLDGSLTCEFKCCILEDMFICFVLGSTSVF